MSLLEVTVEAPPPLRDRRQLRHWWHSILSKHGRFPSYAFFLALPSDEAAIHYLTEQGNELRILSGESCLIIALSDIEITSYDFATIIPSPDISSEFWSAIEAEAVKADDTWTNVWRIIVEQINENISRSTASDKEKRRVILRSIATGQWDFIAEILNDVVVSKNIFQGIFENISAWDWQYLESIWRASVDRQVNLGLSSEVADYFGVGYDEFPCLIIFEDIRSPKHIVVTLKNLDTQEISTQMRWLFSVLRMAHLEKHSPIHALITQQNNERFIQAGQSIISKVRSVADKTPEIFMEALIKKTLAG